MHLRVNKTGDRHQRALHDLQEARIKGEIKVHTKLGDGVLKYLGKGSYLFQTEPTPDNFAVGTEEEMLGFLVDFIYLEVH